MMTLIDTVPGALVLIAAGVFQFTPLKQTCLRHCRSPAGFITRRKRPGVTGAFVMGLDHGVYCLGCGALPTAGPFSLPAQKAAGRRPLLVDGGLINFRRSGCSVCCA